MLGARLFPAAPPRAFPRIFTESSGRGLFIITDDHFYYVFIADFKIIIPLTHASSLRRLHASHIRVTHDFQSFITSVFVRCNYAFHSLLAPSSLRFLDALNDLFFSRVCCLPSFSDAVYRTDLNNTSSFFRELAHSSLVGYGSSRAEIILCHD